MKTSDYNKIMKIQIAVLFGAAFVAVSASNYDENLSLKAAHYSGASYCMYELIDAWFCGGHCDAIPGVSNIHRAFDPETRTFGYTAYEPNSDLIVLAFRGSNGPDGATGSQILMGEWCRILSAAKSTMVSIQHTIQ